MEKKKSKQLSLEGALKLGKDIDAWEGGYRKIEYDSGWPDMFEGTHKYPAKKYNLVGEKDGLKLSVEYVEVFGGFQFDGSYNVELKNGKKTLFSKSDGRARSGKIEKLVRDRTAQILKEKRKEKCESKISNKLKQKLLWSDSRNLKELSLEEGIELVRATPEFSEKISHGGHEGWNYGGTWYSASEIEDMGPNQYIKWIRKFFDGEAESLDLKINLSKEQKVIYGSDAGEKVDYSLNIQDLNDEKNSVSFDQQEKYKGQFDDKYYHRGFQLKKLLSDIEKKHSSNPELTAESIKRLEKKEKNRIKKIHKLMIGDLDKKLNAKGASWSYNKYGKLELPSGYYVNSSFDLGNFKINAKVGTGISRNYTDHTTVTKSGSSLGINAGGEKDIVYATLITGGHHHFHSFFGNSDSGLDPEKDWNIRKGSFQIPLERYDKIIRGLQRNKDRNYSFGSLFAENLLDINNYLK